MSKIKNNKPIIKFINKSVLNTSIEIADNMTGNAISIIKSLVENTREYYKEINKQKLYDFYMGLYELDDDVEIKMTEDNFAFLIKKFIQDDEIIKTKLYSRLAINIAKSEFSNEERIDFISTLSDLKSYDIDFARKFYIYENFNIKYTKNKEEILLKISESQDGRQIKSLNRLHSNGLIFEHGKGKAAKQYYKATDYLNDFIRIIFDENDLTPDIIDECEKNKSDIFFRQNHEYFSRQPMYDEKIIKPLQEMGYSVITNSDTYGPYNDSSDIYFSVDNDKPFVELSDKKSYLSLIIETNEEIFFDQKKIPQSRYHICSDYLIEGSENNINSIKNILQSYIDQVNELRRA
ncbi:hypothetical protein H0250_02985 [Pectobacterium carotovorum]|uniref:hypothetical protein n=1 Tax=Pectobacterium carotovorum TaxID=554 RepID=UPI0015DDCE42|nr:hypothetical protein [Pectobacterium carotovorum]MBA0199474.1 hypothetical protein [Pectobacterium carotovorum]